MTDNKQLAIAIGSFVLLLATAVFAADEQAVPKPIRLKDFIQEALDNNPELRAAKYEATAKEAEIGPRGAYEDPMVTFGAVNYPVDTLSPREFGMTGNEVTLTQKVPFPGKLSKQRRAAVYEYNAQREMFRGKQLQLIKDVKSGYYELYLAYRKRDILNEQRDLFRQLIVVTRNNYAVGKVAQAELLNMQLEEANLVDQLLMAEKLIKIKSGDLTRLLGRKGHETISRPEEVHKTRFDFVKHDEKVISEKILDRNPDFKAAGLKADQAETKLSYARWNYLPDFEFRLGYMFRQSNMEDRGVDTVSGMIGMTIPIWAFTKQSEEVRGASAEKAKAESMLEESRNDLTRQIHNAYAELQEANKRLELYDTALLPLAKQSVTVGRPAYLTGKIEYTTLLNAINKRFQTEYAHSEALVAYETRIAEFEALLGGPLGE